MQQFAPCSLRSPVAGEAPNGARCARQSFLPLTRTLARSANSIDLRLNPRCARAACRSRLLRSLTPCYSALRNLTACVSTRCAIKFLRAGTAAAASMRLNSRFSPGRPCPRPSGRLAKSTMRREPIRNRPNSPKATPKTPKTRTRQATSHAEPNPRGVSSEKPAATHTKSAFPELKPP